MTVVYVASQFCFLVPQFLPVMGMPGAYSQGEEQDCLQCEKFHGKISTHHHQLHSFLIFSALWSATHFPLYGAVALPIGLFPHAAAVVREEPLSKSQGLGSIFSSHLMLLCKQMFEIDLRGSLSLGGWRG